MCECIIHCLATKTTLFSLFISITSISVSYFENVGRLLNSIDIVYLFIGSGTKKYRYNLKWVEMVSALGESIHIHSNGTDDIQVIVFFFISISHA